MRNKRDTDWPRRAKRWKHECVEIFSQNREQRERTSLHPHPILGAKHPSPKQEAYLYFLMIIKLVNRVQRKRDTSGEIERLCPPCTREGVFSPPPNLAITTHQPDQVFAHPLLLSPCFLFHLSSNIAEKKVERVRVLPTVLVRRCLQGNLSKYVRITCARQGRCR